MEHRTGPGDAQNRSPREIVYHFRARAIEAQEIRRALAQPWIAPASALLPSDDPNALMRPRTQAVCQDCSCCAAQLCAQAYADQVPCWEKTATPEAERTEQLRQCPCTASGPSADTAAS